MVDTHGGRHASGGRTAAGGGNGRRWAGAVLVALGVAAAAGLAAAQSGAGAPAHLRFQRLSIEQGLSQSSVQSIAQDPLGFMWFATEDGLNRYDGYAFTVYKPRPLDAAWLSDTYINVVAVDGAGVLWVGTYGGGLNRFDRRAGRFTVFRHDPAEPSSLSDDNVTAILADRHGTLWVGTARGLNRFDAATGRWQRYRPQPDRPHSLPHDRVTALADDLDGSLWVGTAGGGVSRLDPSTGRFQQVFPRPGEAVDAGAAQVLALCLDRAGALWLGTDGGGLGRLDTATGRVTRYRHRPDDPASLGSDTVRAILRDADGDLWLGTAGGLDLMDAARGAFRHFRHDPADSQSLANNEVLAVRQDRSGLLWAGTLGGGVNKFRKREKFAAYTRSPNDPGSLAAAVIFAFAEEADGALWVGTYGGGLDRLDRRTGRITHYRPDPARADALPDGRIRCLARGPDGRLWIGTAEGGLSCLDPTSGRFRTWRHQPGDPASLGENVVRCLGFDPQGYLWVGTVSAGVHRFDPATGRFTRHAHDPADPNSLAAGTVRDIFCDRAGTLWLGTDNGLCRFDAARGAFTRFTSDPARPDSLSHPRVFCIHEDRQGILWLGTGGGGLNRFDPATGRSRHYTERDGLPNNLVYGILEDDRGALWLSTNRGLSRFDPAAGGFRNYDASDGLPSNEFNAGAYYRTAAGEMLFGTIDGFAVFHPGAVRDNPFVPPVVVTAFRKFDQLVAADLAATGAALELSHRDNFFAFEFAALDFHSPDKNRYAYKLDGFDREWVRCGARRYASYTNLSGGDYTFRVRGSNNDGVWNERGVAVAVRIQPPLWQRWWFQALLGALFFVLSVVIYRVGRKLVTYFHYWRRSHFVGHYRILETLGRGGLGTVYRARDLVNDRVVALKVLHENAMDETGRRRFIQEGLICERIDHPNIVKVYDRGEHAGQCYYAMEFCRGVTLRALMTDGRLTVGDALAVFLALAGIVRDLHAAGIIHRDIKPENIMLLDSLPGTGRSGRTLRLQDLARSIKILDFGVAKILDAQSMTQTGTFEGTLYYLPPEYLSGKVKAGCGMDYYALGVVLYEMLTGAKPYRGDGSVELIYAILYGETRPPREVRTTVPEAVSAFVMEVIHKDPSRRLADFAAIQPRVESLLQHLAARPAETE